MARRFLFRTDRAAPLPAPAGAVSRVLTAADGVPVHALELAGPPGAPVVVHFHDNSETAAHPVWIGRALRERGLGVLLVEYRGYGVSRGPSPTEAGLYLDAEAALGWLADHGVPASRVVLWGSSLGTGVAAEMARRGHGGALALVSPYTSIPGLVSDVVPVLPARLLVDDRFDTLAKAPLLRVPTLVIHGDADDVVPFWMGARLAETIPGARLVLVRGGRHGDLFAREAEGLVAEIAGLASALR